MRATEVLEQYANGRRDFSGENLRGQSFKGKNLSGSNFSAADIRGVDFSNANLKEANFTGVKAGAQCGWGIVQVTASLLVSAVSVLFAVFGGMYTGMIIADIADGADGAVFIGVLNFIVLAVFCIITIRNGLRTALVFLAVILIVSIAISVKLPGYAIAATSFLVLSMSVALAVTGAVAGFVTAAVQATMTGLVGAISAMGYAMLITVVASSSIDPTESMPRLDPTESIRSLPLTALWAVVAVVIAVVSQSAYVGWRALAGDEKQAFIRGIAIAFAATGSTSFRGADLTDANFTYATLKSTDFRRAILTRTRWHQTKKHHHVRPGTTYLKNAQLRQLLITGQGQDKSFDRKDLRGVNLQGANLQDTSFVGADLSQANLQDANLSRAKLVQTQLDEADLTGATLTGAYIEDWGITSHTKLHGVRCEYIFMREPTKENPNPRRKPDNWNETFKDGDFADFIKPIVDTLDLYHNQDVDPRAIAISFKQLAENHPEAELEIVAMEKRGGDKFLLRAATAPEANHSELNAEYFDTYNKIKALAEQELQALLDEKDNRIHSLENMIATALQRPSFYANTYHQVGDFMSESKGNINITSGDGSNISGVAGAGENMTGSAMADVSGTVTIAINELPPSPEPNKPGIKELLSQLQTAINDPNLADDDKTQALEQVKVLAEAGKNPNNETAQKQAKRAMGFLKVIAEGLPSAAQLAKTCQDVLPAIAHFFGL